MVDLGDTREVLVFVVGGRRYALASSAVREIVRAVAVVALPRAPAIVEGVVDVRGAVVPVLDLRARFGLPPSPLHPAQHFIVAWAGERLVALRVDRAVEVVRLAPSALSPAEGLGPGVEYVAGVAKLPDGMALIHDLRTFLSSAESDALGRSLADVAGAGAAG